MYIGVDFLIYLMLSKCLILCILFSQVYSLSVCLGILEGSQVQSRQYTSVCAMIGLDDTSLRHFTNQKSWCNTEDIIMDNMAICQDAPQIIRHSVYASGLWQSGLQARGVIQFKLIVKQLTYVI